MYNNVFKIFYEFKLFSNQLEEIGIEITNPHYVVGKDVICDVCIDYMNQYVLTNLNISEDELKEVDMIDLLYDFASEFKGESDNFFDFIKTSLVAFFQTTS